MENPAVWRGFLARGFSSDLLHPWPTRFLVGAPLRYALTSFPGKDDPAAEGEGLGVGRDHSHARGAVGEGVDVVDDLVARSLAGDDLYDRLSLMRTGRDSVGGDGFLKGEGTFV